MKRNHSALITFEGVDGSGKSTQCRLIYHQLLAEGYTVHLYREPGGTKISEQIRNILLHPENTLMSPITEMLLYFASRNQLLHEKIKPALAEDQIVLLDRFVDRTLAYQGFGRGLDMEAIQKVREVAIGDLKPDLTVLVDTPLDTAEERLDKDSLDRLESEHRDFKERTRNGYLELAARDPQHWLVVDGRDDIQNLKHQIWQRIQKLLTDETD